MDFNKPDIFVLEGDIAQNFQQFKEDIETYFVAKEITRKSNAVQVACLKNLMGKEALHLYKSIARDQHVETVQSIMSILEAHCLPKKNEIMNVFKFITCKQAVGEPFDKFLMKLRSHAICCEFGSQEDKLMKAQIALGISSQEVQERLLRDDVSLNKMIQYCKSVELAQLNMKQLKDDSGGILHTDQISKMNKSNNNNNMGPTHNHNTNRPRYSESKNCQRCGSVHINKICPALGKQCNWCKKLNHFSMVCRQRQLSKNQNQLQERLNFSMQPLHGIQSEEQSQDDSNLELIDSVHLVNGVHERVWYKTVLVDSKKINFKLDTGAEVNILPFDILKQSNLQYKLRKSTVRLEAYGGFKIVPLGKITAQVETNNKFDVIDFIVVKRGSTPILGLEACTRLGIIQRTDEVSSDKGVVDSLAKSKQRLFDEFNDVFTGLGCFPDECSVKLSSNAVPYASSARRIPIKIHDKLKTKLEDLETKGVIERVNEPVEWVSNVVIVEKPDASLRICIDPQHLNKYIIRERFTIPTIEEISPKLANKRYFSVLDIKDGFYHIKLDANAAKLYNFSTVFGTYRFLRSPFGLSNLPELFHKCVYKYFGDIPGVTVYFDDICIASDTKEENYLILKKVLDRARALNIKFNYNKFQYCLPEIKYLGMLFSESGMQPDPEKIKVIKALRNPKNKTELQRLLGMVNFLRAFIPNLSHLTSPLRDLLKKDVHWYWTEVHTKALDDIKRILASEQVIASFNQKDPVVIQCDASKDSLGCCLLQNNRPVYMASRSMNSAEEGYAQVEKELLAIVFACTKLHTYIYGHNDITINTDHMPLVSLISKDINKVQNNRLRRLKLKLLPYRFKLQYLPGKYMYIADFLSRCGIGSKEKPDETMLDMVHCVSECGVVQFSDKRLEEFKNETLTDEVLGKTVKYYIDKWPTEISCGGELAHYFKKRNEIDMNDGLLYYNSRLIVPLKLRYLIMKRLHETHLGETKMNGIVSNFYYWPGVRSAVRNVVESCDLCQKYRRSNKKETLIPHDIPNIPFLKVGADIAEWAGKIYLVVVDYYSRWLEIIKMNGKNSLAVKSGLIQIFSRFGIPQILIADNVPFNSHEMNEFSKQWNFKIQTTSPNYPQSNGLAEKGVGIAKKMIKIAIESGQDINLSLLNYRNSVVSGLGNSPAELVMGRTLRSKLPLPYDKLTMKVVNHSNISNQIRKNQQSQAQYYDRKCKSESKYKRGDHVYVQDCKTKSWEPGVIASAEESPRSYMVKTDRGITFRRNSRFIRRRQDSRFKGNCNNILKGEDV